MSYHAHQELFLRKISAEKGHKHRESNAQEMAQEQFDQFNAAMATAHTPSDACSDYACSDDACSTDDMSHVLPPLPQKEEQKRKGQIDPNAQAIRSLLSQMLSRAIVRKQVRQDGDIGDILKRLEHSCKGMVSTADFGDAAVTDAMKDWPYDAQLLCLAYKAIAAMNAFQNVFSAKQKARPCGKRTKARNKNIRIQVNKKINRIMEQLIEEGKLSQGDVQCLVDSNLIEMEPMKGDHSHPVHGGVKCTSQ